MSGVTKPRYQMTAKLCRDQNHSAVGITNRVGYRKDTDNPAFCALVGDIVSCSFANAMNMYSMAFVMEARSCGHLFDTLDLGKSVDAAHAGCNRQSGMQGKFVIFVRYSFNQNFRTKRREA